MPISRKPLSQAEKSLIVVCIFAVVPLAGIVYLAGGRDAEPQWNIAAAAPRPTPNGYDFYVAAAKATKRFKPEIDPASDATFNLPNSPYALKNYSLARRQQWLKANAGAFALVNQGLKTPSMVPVYAPGKPMGDWALLRQLARDMSARSRTFQLAKQPMRATLSTLDGMQLGQDTARGGGLLSRLVSVAIMAIGRSPLDDWNKTINELDASEARTAARRLEALLAREPSGAQTLTADKGDSLRELRRIFAMDGWRKMAAPADPPGLRQNVSRFWQSQTTSKRTIHDNLVRTLDAQIANSKLPYSQVRTATLPTDLDIFTPSLTGSGSRMGLIEARHMTSNNMLLLRLALRAYITEHGAAPATLAALVPDTLKSIPTDIYNDGKPLFYKPQGKTYKLWSVGPDGIDNGGIPFAPRKGSKASVPVSNTLDNTGDFVAGLCR